VPDVRDAVATASPAGAVPGAGGGAEAGDGTRPRAAEEVGPARQAVARLLAPAAGGAGGARVFERTNTDARVILRAREASWVQVSSRAGDYTFTRTLEPGEAVLLPNRGDLVLWTGNAHGLEVMVDGAPVALAPGPMVRRNIPLDPDRLSAASEAPR
jgi:cytoskeleton protein RodZ